MGKKIIPLHLGTFHGMETSNLLYQVNPGVKVRQPILGWLILGGEFPIVIDTGGSDEEWAKKYHHGIDRPYELTMEAQLGKHGLTPDDVPLVINTHLHWDHCFQNDLFKNARFLVQRLELHGAVAPLPTQNVGYEVGIPGVIPSWMKTFDRTDVIHGDAAVCDGVEVVLLPGHSPGLQGVVVETTHQRFLIASDTVGVYENWTGNEKMKHIPQGIHWDLVSYFETFEKMERIGAEVLPSHDMRVLERDVYE